MLERRPEIACMGVAWSSGVNPLTTANNGSNQASINKAAQNFRNSISNTGISSEHPGIGNVALLDGSVRALRFQGLDSKQFGEI